MTKVQHFYDSETFTLSYIVWDELSKDAVCIDPVWNLDWASGRLSKKSFHDLVDFIEKSQLKLHMILETHAHADHLTGAQLLKEKYPHIKIGIGNRITKVQKLFQKTFNMKDSEFKDDMFDVLFSDGQEMSLGALRFSVNFTPGHTPACVNYYFPNESEPGLAFTGDALFVPDSGTGRCDFPEGSAKELYHSITQKIYTLPDDTKTFTGHDYQPGNRELKFQATVKEHKANNIQLKGTTSLEEYVSFREARDRTLAAPKLLLPSLQVNILAGKLPSREENGVSYLKVPIREDAD